MQSGSFQKRFLLSISAVAAALLLLFCPALSPAADIPKPDPDVVKLLPKIGDIAGWEVYQDTLVYAGGENLTEIYDGGYELYTKNGVEDAAQQMYRLKDKTAIIAIHRMNSIKVTNRFFEYWRKPGKKQPTYKPVKALCEGYIYIADGSANGLLIRNKYFVTASVYIDGEKGRSAAEEFLKSISVQIGNLVRSG